MLAIRMQRTGRKGHPMYRMIVQDSHRQPTSGKIVALLGSYDPHTKKATLDTEKAEFYLKNGAQPSDRATKVLSDENVALPSWVKKAADDKQKSIKNKDKLRRNREEEPAEVPAAPATDEAAAEDTDEVESDVPQNDDNNEVQAAETEEPVADEAPEEKPESEDKAASDNQKSEDSKKA